MANEDSLQRFIFEDIDIRGEIVHLNQSYQTILKQHQYPISIQQLLGEALASAVLLGATIKYKGQLTIQFQSNGPVKLLVVNCNNRYEIRGLAQFDAKALQRHDMQKSLLGDGHLIITIGQERNLKTYQSIISLNNQPIAESIENYFAQSEQLATKISFAVNENCASGMLLQLMPDQSIQDRENFWEYAVKISDTITDDELLNLDNMILLKRVYHEENLRVFSPHDVIFKCVCDLEKMENAVRMLGKRDASKLLKEKHKIVVKCEFCGHEYAFDKVDIEHIFQKKKGKK